MRRFVDAGVNVKLEGHSKSAWGLNIETGKMLELTREPNCWLFFVG
jgi:hypothetical protein